MSRTRPRKRPQFRTPAAVAWLCALAVLLAAGLATAGPASGDPRTGKRERAPDAERDNELDTAIEAAFEATFRHYQLPGLALGVIVDGKVVARRTAGELVAGEGRPVTPRSLFKIASNSKAMTTAMLARLVDRGLLRWDDPVRRHLPQFRMHDPWVGEHMQVRDLLIHNSGLGKGAGDLMLWPEPNDFTRADVIAGLAHLVPTHSFRAHYAYDNVLYIVAGEVAAAAAGAPWETLVQREVFEPLGLHRCQAGGFDRDAVGEVAQPHMRVDGRNVSIRRDGAHVPAITSAAAGGIRCSLDDMLAWASVWLDPDAGGHGDWLSAQQRAAVWSAHMPMPVSARQRDWNATHFHAYGYGWRLADVNGHYTVGHTGTLAGMYSALVLLPDRRSGFVMLMNGNGGEARTVLTQVLLELLTVPERARSVAAVVQALEADRLQHADSGDAPTSPERSVVAPASLVARLGVWRDPWFGEVSICPEGGRVRFRSHRSPHMDGTIMRAGDGLLVDWTHPSVDAEPWLHFATDTDTGAQADAGDSRAGRLTLSHVDPDADFSYDYADLDFRRVRDCDAAPATPPVVGQPASLSSARSAREAGLVDAATVVPRLQLDIRYAGSDNFTGAPVPGYEAPRCLLLRPAALALREADRALREMDRAPKDGHLRLRAFDCYRPVRAVQQFVAWVGNEDRSTQSAYYPDLEKPALLGGYIAESSGHSRGATLDVTLERCDAHGCAPLDMGTPFDFFDERAHTDSPAVTAEQRRNRLLLRDAMARGGFANYPLEWWHYSWSGLADDAPAFDVVVR